MMRIDLATTPLQIQKEIYQVLTETFNRVSFNIKLIYTELKNIGYAFWQDGTEAEQALLNPVANIDQLLIELDKAVNPLARAIRPCYFKKGVSTPYQRVFKMELYVHSKFRSK